MRLCIVLADPRLALNERPRRPSQLDINEQMRVEDALLGLGRDAARALGATVVALAVGGRRARSVARHALTAGVTEVIRVPVDDLGAWPDADAAALIASLIRHVGCDLALIGAEGVGGWDRLAGLVAGQAEMAVCTSMLTLVNGEELIAEHELEHERVRLAHSRPLVSTVARTLLASAPCFGYGDVVRSAGRPVATLDPSDVGIAPPGNRAQRLVFSRLEDAPRRREITEDADGVDAAVHFLQVIGALR
ncbi:MAG TPA: hypothetical protein VHV75_04030 [Solirubrobacteraceae bacterium]|jgi:electron transfer flavoprotein alpha/beta subunit|nr:hypothetical protein [Solirubrobacteraceae bacterium]